MIDVLDRIVLGYRADGRPVSLVRGGAEDPVPAADPAGAPADPATDPAGDGAEELEFTEESFKKLIEEHNALQAAQAAKDEDWRKKLHAASQDASRYRQQARTLAGLVGEGATGKPGPKAAATAKSAASAVGEEGDARLAELSAKLEAAQRGSLLSSARAALAEAGVPKSAIAAAVRMVDLAALELGPSGEVSGLDEQIEAFKEAVPQLFATPAVAPAVNGNGTGTGARVLRAAPAVAGRGAAGRGGEAPKVPTSSEVLANRLLGKSDE